MILFVPSISKRINKFVLAWYKIIDTDKDKHICVMNIDITILTNNLLIKSKSHRDISKWILHIWKPAINWHSRTDTNHDKKPRFIKDIIERKMFCRTVKYDLLLALDLDKD